MPFDLAFIGAGNMAEAIARGLLDSGTLTADRMIAADVAEARRELFEKELGIRCVTDNLEAVRDAQAILLATKPQQLEAALKGIGEVLSEKALVISIAAGISTRLIETALGLGKEWKVVRTMPNTPVLVRLGAVALAPGRYATRADVSAARRYFEPAAVVVETTEDKLDAVTAVSGSGPAYVFYLIENMIAAAVELGLPKEQAELLAKQTVLGAATMASTSPDSPEELRRKVTSPGGTTQAAIEFMEAHAIGRNIRYALDAAAKRSVELGKK